MVVRQRQPGPSQPPAITAAGRSRHQRSDPARARGQVVCAVRAPRVFVSYAHDNPGHRRRVLQLCAFLRAHGCDVRVDQWYDGPRQDWYVWAIDQITRADYVLVIASRACRAAGDGRLTSQIHRGIQTELALLRDRQHSNRRVWQRKILPVILPGNRHRDIPLFLLPHIADYYTVNAFTQAGAADLLAALGVARPESVRPGSARSESA
jgi:SEFIR domain-containing protein